MDRLSIGLAVGVGVLLLSNLYFFRANTNLQTQRDALAVELREVRHDLAEARRAKLEAASQAVAQRPGAGRALRRSGEGQAAAQGAGGATNQAQLERVAEMRDRVRGAALDRLLAAVEATGQERSWAGEQIAQTSSLIETSYEEANGIRERLRAREIDPAKARAELEAVQSRTKKELIALLGEDEHAALKANVRSAGAEIGGE